MEFEEIFANLSKYDKNILNKREEEVKEILNNDSNLLKRRKEFLKVMEFVFYWTKNEEINYFEEGFLDKTQKIMVDYFEGKFPKYKEYLDCFNQDEWDYICYNILLFSKRVEYDSRIMNMAIAEIENIKETSSNSKWNFGDSLKFDFIVNELFKKK